MRPVRAFASVTLLVSSVLFALAPETAEATEAAAGHYIPGVFAVPLAGAIPPPGFYWSTSTIYYHGSAAGTLEVPIAGQVALGLKADIVGQSFNGLWVPNLDLGANTSFSLAVSIPVEWVDVSANLGNLIERQSQTALGDIAIVPTLGWHSGKHFLSTSLYIYTPTGAWKDGALDNVGMNYWTFSPTVSYTYFDPEAGFDASIVTGIDINTRNPDTDYRSGAIWHVDANIMKHVNEKLSLGVLGAILYQVEDDDGGIAARLDGFKGRSFAIGPMLKYTAGSKENPINISLSWAAELETKNRPKGNAFYLSVAGKF